MEKTFWQRNREAAIVLILVIPCCLVSVLTIYAPRHGLKPWAWCLSNMKQTSTAALMYMSDHDGRMPLANWMEGLSLQLKDRDVMGCPQNVHEKKAYGFALKSGLEGINETHLQAGETMVMFFEASSSRDNVIANLSERVSWHQGASNVGFFDGHARRVDMNTPLR
ncbi:MAG: H-X9-DG-CTERM domain-containing protein [Fimbriimonadaceae bacterium]